MRALALQLAGAASITTGAFLAHQVAGFITAGVFLTLFGLAAERSAD